MRPASPAQAGEHSHPTEPILPITDNSQSRSTPSWAALVGLVTTLAACGGGTDGSTAAAPASLTLRGTAATGKALAGGAVATQCVTGTATATTNADGSYSLSVAGGALPCIVRVTAADGTVLHSVAEGAGTSSTVNISPLTELIIAQAAGGSAASLYTLFDAAAQAKVGAAGLAAASAAVTAALQSVVSLAGINPIKDVLVAANGNVAGNALDQKLDTLSAALAAAKLTVSDLAAAIVNNGAGAAAVVGSHVKPAAATCASLRSGNYRVINPNESEAKYRLRLVSVDVLAMTIQSTGDPTDSFVPVAGKPCHFSTDKGRTNFIVSPAGVVVNHYLANDGSNAPRVLIAVPAQAIALADLAGTWNTVELSRDNGSSNPAVNSYAVVTVDAAGVISAISDCKKRLPCTAEALPLGFTAHADGGFEVSTAEGIKSRFFAYRAASGDTLLVGLFPQGVMAASKQRALVLPALGDVTSFWDVSVNSQAVASSLLGDVSTVTGVDAAAGTYTRSRSSDGRVDTFSLNALRPGLRTRAAASCKSAAGAATGCSGIIVMPLAGMGLSVYGSADDGSDFFGLSVARPAGSTAIGVQTAAAVPSAGTALGASLVSGRH